MISGTKFDIIDAFGDYFRNSFKLLCYVVKPDKKCGKRVNLRNNEFKQNQFCINLKRKKC